MSRPGVTYFEVAKATQTIVGKGKTPTIELIRSLLGTGSNGTIAAHLRTWREQQDQTQQLALKAELPEELISLMKGLWERVTSEANAKIDEIQQSVQTELAELKSKLQKLEQENAVWQQKHHQEKQEKAGLVQERVVLEQILQTCKQEVAELRATQEGLAKQIREKQDRIEELHHQNKQTQSNLEHYRTASAEQRQMEQQRHEQQQREVEQTIQAVRSEWIQAQQENLRLKQSNENLRFENEDLTSQLCKARSSNEVITGRLQETQMSLAEQINAAQHWKAQYESASTKWEEQYQKNAKMQGEQGILIHEIESMQNKLNEIVSQNSVLTHEKWILGQEKAELLGQMKQLESSRKSA